MADEYESRIQLRLEVLLPGIHKSLQDALRTRDEQDMPRLYLDQGAVKSAVDYLRTLGLDGDADRLREQADKLINVKTDILACEEAKGQSLEETGALQEILGTFPLPLDDNAKHKEAQDRRKVELTGRISNLAEFLEELLTSLKSQQSKQRGLANDSAQKDKGAANEGQDSGKKHEAGRSTNKRSWIQSEVDEAVRHYRADRADVYSRYIVAISRLSNRKKRTLVNQARRIFGRNVIAKHLGCPPAMVSNSQAWKSIRAELFKDSVGRTSSAEKRIGLGIADEQAATDSHRQKRLEEQERDDMEKRLSDLSPEELDVYTSELLGED